jgi:hypothetical protein
VKLVFCDGGSYVGVWRGVEVIETSFNNTRLQLFDDEFLIGAGFERVPENFRH